MFHKVLIKLVVAAYDEGVPTREVCDELVA